MFIFVTTVWTPSPLFKIWPVAIPVVLLTVNTVSPASAFIAKVVEAVVVPEPVTFVTDVPVFNPVPVKGEPIKGAVPV